MPLSFKFLISLLFLIVSPFSQGVTIGLHMVSRDEKDIVEGMVAREIQSLDAMELESCYEETPHFCLTLTTLPIQYKYEGHSVLGYSIHYRLDQYWRVGELIRAFPDSVIPQHFKTPFGLKLYGNLYPDLMRVVKQGMFIANPSDLKEKVRSLMSELDHDIFLPYRMALIRAKTRR